MAPEAAAVTSAGEAAWWRPEADGLPTSPAAVLDKLGPDPRSQLEPRNARFLLFFDPVFTENVADASWQSYSTTCRMFLPFSVVIFNHNNKKEGKNAAVAS